MNQKAFRTLEYNKIIELLTDCATSPLGKEKARHLLPSTDIDEIRQAQRETSDALTHLLQKGSLSFSGLTDITPSLKRLEVGASLSSTELLRISSLLTVALKAKTYGRKETQEEKRKSG